MNVVALIPAAGSGKRMGSSVSKQYLEIGGKPVVTHTLEVFESCDEVSEIYLIVPEEDCAYACELIDGIRSFKTKKVVTGGKERQDSVRNGLDSIHGCDIVIIHDGVRPFVSEEAIKRSIETASTYGAAIVAVPAKDTIKSVDENMDVVETLERSKLWQVQTPQTFRYELIKDAFQKAYRDGYYGTDDASLVERLGHKVHIVEGSYRNIKITTPEDMVVGEAILMAKSAQAGGF